MAEKGVTDRHTVYEIDRHLLTGAVALDRRRPVRDRNDACLDGDVAARDARVREQARVLEEDMHELPELSLIHI